MMQKLTLLLGAIALGLTMLACQPEPQGDTNVVVEPGSPTIQTPPDVNVNIENDPPPADVDIDIIVPPSDDGDDSTYDDN